MKHSRFKAILAIFALLGALNFSTPSASAQEAAPAVTQTAPAPTPAPVTPEGPKVTARKEDEKEVEQAEAPVVNPNLSWLQKQVAKMASIPTETSNAEALAAITAERDSLKEQLDVATASAAAAVQATSAAQTELAELNSYLDQMRNAPGDLLASDPSQLPAAHQDLAAIITTTIQTELGKINQPAKQLPGPGADAPKGSPAPAATLTIDPKNALAGAAATQRAAWAAGGYVPPGLS